MMVDDNYNFIIKNEGPLSISSQNGKADVVEEDYYL